MDRRALSFGLAGLIVVLDRLAKLWIEKNVALWDSFHVIPGFFDIVHTQNRGMAFGLFNDSTSPWRTFLLVGVTGVVLVFIIVMIWKLPEQAIRYQKLTPVSLGLILGGALGNFYDRIVAGRVTDFLDLYAGDWHWPAFNVADSAITIGAILMAFELLMTPPAEKET